MHVALLGISGRFEYKFNTKGLYFLKKTDDSCCLALRHMKGTWFWGHAELWESGQQVAHPKHLFIFINSAETQQKVFREANTQNIYHLCNVCNGSPLLSLISSQFTYKRDIISLGSFISPKHCQVCWQSFEALQLNIFTKHIVHHSVYRFKDTASALRAGTTAELKPRRFPLWLLVCLRKQQSPFSTASPRIRWGQQSLLWYRSAVESHKWKAKLL